MKTIIQCMCSITEKMRDPERTGQIIINDDNSQKAASELRMLRKALGMNTMQVLILTAIIQKSSRYRIDGDNISTFLGMEYLQFLTHDNDMEELRKRGYIRIDKEGHISVPKEILKNLIANKAVEPEPTTGLSTGKILNRMKKILSIRSEDEMTTEEAFDEINALLKGNTETSISRACDKYIKHVDCNEAMVFFALIYRYWYEHDDMVGWHDIDDYLDEDELDELQTEFRMEIMDLQCGKVIEYAGKDGMLTKDFFRIKDAIKEEIFEDVGGIKKKDAKISASRKMEAVSINRKELFYNSAEGCQVAQLKELLSDKSFNGIRARMKDKGLRSGFTCLFYGSPGTGKRKRFTRLLAKADATSSSWTCLKSRVAGLGIARRTSRTSSTIIAHA